MAEIRPLLIWLLLLGLFAMAIVTGGIMLAEQNGVNQSIADDPAITEYYSSLNETLADTYTDASNSDAAFSNSSISTSIGIPFIDSIWGIWKTLKEVPVTIYNLTIGLLISKVLGDVAGAIVLSVLSAILIITVIFAIVKLVSQGESG